jgi:hypothetical protein
MILRGVTDGLLVTFLCKIIRAYGAVPNTSLRAPQQFGFLLAEMLTGRSAEKPT